MEERLHRNFRNYFLSNQDKLIMIIETTTGRPVDKLLAVTLYLDTAANELLECICLSNDELMNFRLNVSDVTEED